jgi:hypothetical protein
MKRVRVVIVVVLAALILGFCGYMIYSDLMIKWSEPPEPTVFSYSEDYWKGRYCFAFSRAETAEANATGFIVVMDSQGKYLAYNSSRAMYNYIYQLSENGIYCYVSPGMGQQGFTPEARIWNFEMGATRTILKGINIWGHHAFLIEDGYFVTLRKIDKGGLDTIVQLDPKTGNETWVWSSEPYFTQKACSMCPDNDWLHSNDVSVSLDGRYYYINFRNADSFAKINRETKKVEWICGRNGNFTLLENGVKKESLWYHSHVIKEVRPDVFLTFDNDYHNRTHLGTYPPGENPYTGNYGGHSRLIEVTLNESKMTAEITWSYTPGPEYYSMVFGDIDILPNGNIAGLFGVPVHKWTPDHKEIENPFGAAILEVNRDGKLIREYRFPLGCAIYRIQELSENPADYVGSWLLKLP